MKKRNVVLIGIVIICLSIICIQKANQNQGMQFIDTEDLNLYHTNLDKEILLITGVLELSSTISIKDLSLSYDHTGDIKSLYIVFTSTNNDTLKEYELYYEDGNRYGIRTYSSNTINMMDDRINKSAIISLIDYFRSIQYGPEEGYIYKLSYEGQMSLADNSNCFIYNTRDKSLIKADQDTSDQAYKLSKQKIISEQELESESYEIYFLE